MKGLRDFFRKLLEGKEEELEDFVCSKCGDPDVYIACPNHCRKCYNKYELNLED
jgi:predicted RNA-binding Zn-ribbon protein involved in translation (DUF1610 family)